MPPQMRQEMEAAIHKAQVSAAAAGCTESFDVSPDEVVGWRRLRESRVMEAKRQSAVELAIATSKVCFLCREFLLRVLVLIVCLDFRRRYWIFNASSRHSFSREENA